MEELKGLRRLGVWEFLASVAQGPSVLLMWKWVPETMMEIVFGAQFRKRSGFSM